MVSVFNVDDLAGQRHIACDGFFIDVHGDFAEGHRDAIILRQLKPQMLFACRRSSRARVPASASGRDGSNDWRCPLRCALHQVD